MLHSWPYDSLFRIIFASMKHGVSAPPQVLITAGGRRDPLGGRSYHSPSSSRVAMYLA